MKQNKMVFDRERFAAAVAPSKIIDVMYDMRLTPSQMQTFFITEPSIARLKTLRVLLPKIDFIDLCVPAPVKKNENE